MQINESTLTMYQFNFEKLDVWQKSKLLAKEVYGLTKFFSRC